MEYHNVNEQNISFEALSYRSGAAFIPPANSPPAIGPPAIGTPANDPPAKSPPPAANHPPVDCNYRPVHSALSINDISCCMCFIEYVFSFLLCRTCTVAPN